MSRHFLQPCLAAPDTRWALTNETTGRSVAATMIPAFDRRSRNDGLLGRSGLPRGAALVLAPCSGVHTWFMRFPLDIVFVDRTGRVQSVRRAVGPWRVALRVGAFAVVELAAGGAEGIEPGHVIGVLPGSTSSTLRGDAVDVGVVRGA